MKVLYISPENTVGTLSLWKRAHEELGNECSFITLYPSKQQYDEGICLNLPLIHTSSWYIKSRHLYYQKYRGKLGDYKEKNGFPPIWQPNSIFENWYFDFRDWLWHFKIEPLIKKLKLLEYDIFHLEWGLEFYRDGRFVKRLKELNKPIVCTYHGQDLRTRGVIPKIDQFAVLNLTSELDLLKKHPNINYLYLPFDTKQFLPSSQLNKPIKVCHSPTSRHYKGSNTIIPICEKLEAEGKIEFKLIENMSHKKALKLKSECDIFIDQVHNRGGWGYGMNSIEALSMGLCCLTELIPEYVEFIPDHPFININGENLYSTLIDILDNPPKIHHHKKMGREWVVNKHDLIYTAEKLYEFYREKSWL